MDFFSGTSDELIEYTPIQTLIPINHLLDEPNLTSDLAPISGSSSYYYSSDQLDTQPDYYEACISYIHEALMEEEDSENSLATLPDYGALVATEKSFYDALNESNPPPSSSIPNQYQSFFHQSVENPNDDPLDDPLESSTWILYQDHQTEPFLYTNDALNYTLDSNSRCRASTSSLEDNVGGLLADSPVRTLANTSLARERKVHRRDENGEFRDLRSNKHLAACDDDDDEEEHQVIQQYDDILLPKNDQSSVGKADAKPNAKQSKGRKSRAKKRNSGRERVVDLSTLLTLCAQAVSGFDLRTANGLLRQIREHSSPFGDCIQRVAHYFANGLEARMAGTGSELYYHFINSQVSPSGVLKCYQCYASAVPIYRTSFYVANMMIARLAEKATRIHVIDFGIYHGFQWPSLIQCLSERPNGPPKLRITGVEYPLKGFRPAEKVERTGRRLKAYCDRFNVPFEYHAIAKTWETIREEDFRIEEGELVMVNCQYRATMLPDEAVDLGCPRDAFLRMIRRLNPDIFIHSVINGSYGVPFFTSRFREALFNYISMFDIYESTMTRDDIQRKVIEQNWHGTDILNVVASEGNERVARPETYKQWQVRMSRAGFRLQPIDRDLIHRSKDIIKAGYHKDFVLDEDSHWMLQGWKGRILFGISCWKPAGN